MNENCFGYFHGKCTVLSPANCDGCSFFCTKRGAEAARYHAAYILEQKGLVPMIKSTENGLIMSTVPAK